MTDERRQHIMKRRQHGFTLIEIAIVLVIIGLLLGGVLKGQELINQAKIKKINNDFESMPALVYAYQDRYKVLPGDDKQATTRWGTTGNAVNNADGNLSYKIDGDFDAATGTTVESRYFWQHMRLAGFIAGDTKSQDQGANSVGGILGVQTNAGPTATPDLNGLVFCSSNLTGKFAVAVDAQFDDGAPNTGSVRGYEIGTATTGTARVAAATAYTDDGVKLYTVCRSLN
jgi:prepilin-type N-terminal cleavage/methylation domain-containing protein